MEGEYIPPHLQVYIGGSRIYCSHPGPAMSIEQARLAVYNEELIVVVGDQKFLYKPVFRNGCLYPGGCPEEYKWIKELTYLLDEDLSGRERIKNWIT